MDEEKIQSEEESEEISEEPEQTPVEAEVKEETAVEEPVELIVTVDKPEEEQASDTVMAAKEQPVNENKWVKPALLILLAVFTIAMSVLGSYLVTKSTIASKERRVVIYEGVETTAVNLTTADLSPIVEKIQDTVVEVYTEAVVYNRFYGEYITSGAGSGVILSQDGYIVTNNHVIDQATNIKVKTADGTEYEALLIAADEDTDLAVLKIDATNLHAATLGNSTNLKVGQGVIAIGNPLGTLGGTVTTGILSSLSRTVTIEDAKMTLLQTDTAISPGNSGGGLFNVSGELIAIVNAKSVSQNVEGIGFAIPIDIAKAVVQDLITYGYVTGRPALGISGAEVDNMQLAQYNGYSHLGIYVSELISEEAKNSGLQPKDLIFELNGVAIDSFATLKYELYKYKAGETVYLKVERNGKEVAVQLVLTAKNNS